MNLKSVQISHTKGQVLLYFDGSDCGAEVQCLHDSWI